MIDMSNAYIMITLIASVLELLSFVCILIFGFCYSIKTLKDEQIDDLKSHNEQLLKENRELKEQIKGSERADERGNKLKNRETDNKFIFGRRQED
ncbi:MAG: hypothetical protein IJW60_03125 [Clostridia bacterium]|nr:hypothetical protein [Clostridia bacterium]